MKDCPKCGKSYADDSLNFCLDDGEWLLAQAGCEPATAILYDTDASSEAGTRPQIHTTAAEQHVPSAAAEKPQAFNKRLILAPMALAVIVIGCFFAYRSFYPSESGRISSIAVLPFENSGGNPDTEYLSDGLAESLIYRLSQFPDLKVSPRSLVFQYKGKAVNPQTLAAELGVDAVMTGRIVQRGDNLAISIDLVDARNNKTLWGNQYERKMSDLLATQREIATAAADKLKLALSGGDSAGVTKQYTTNNEAYQLYLQGRYFWNKRSAENLKRATELLKGAIEKDPNFALAHAGLADCYAVSYYYVGERPRDSVSLVKMYAGKAIELDPTLAEPHTSLGFAYFIDWDLPAAEKEFRRAIELNPNYPTAHHWYSRFLRAMGRVDDAWKEIHRAKELEPLSLIFMNNIAEMHVDRGELTDAASLSRQIIDLDPSFWAGHQTMSITLIKQGNIPEALVEAQKSVEVSNRMNAPLALLGHVYGLQGRRAEAEEIIKELEQRVGKKSADPRDVAVVYMGLRDHDKAIDSLERSLNEHSVFMPYLNLEPLFEPLRNNPRWGDLKRRIGLPE